MFRPRWHKVLSDLWGNKARSLLVIASITIGLFAVGLIVSMHAIITQDMATGYQKVNPANIQMTITPVDQDFIKHLREIPGVKQVEGVRNLTLRVRNAKGQWELLDLVAIPEIDKMQINQVRLEQGTWPPADREIVVDSFKMSKLPVGVGGTIEVELPSGKTREMKVVGATNDQTIGSTGAGGFFLAPVTGYITQRTLEWLEYPDTLNQLLITVDGDANNVEHLREVSNRVADDIEKGDRVVYTSAVRTSDNHPNRVYVQAIASVLFLLGFLVMFLSAFLITNTLSALLTQQEHQIGVMKTIGARRGQIMGIYMVLIFLFGMLAFLIAMPLSSRAAYALLEFLAPQINIALQGYRTVPSAVVIQFAIALVVPQLAGFLPILHGTRITAVEALSGYSQAHPPVHKGWLDRAMHSLRGLSRPVLLSLRNTFRHRGRLALTLFTLTLGGAIFIGTFNAQRSLENYIGRIGHYFLADVNVTLKQSYRIDEIGQVLKEVPGVKEYEAWAAASGELIMPDGSKGESVNLLAPPAGSKLVDPILREGRWVQPGDLNTIAVNERFHEIFPDLKVGDTLRIKINGDEKDFTVVGFFQLSGRSGGFLSYTTYEYLSQVIHQPNRASAFRVNADHSGLTFEEQEALGKTIEEHLKRAGYDVADVEAGQSMTTEVSDGLNILTGFLLIMASLIAIVGSIGLAGTMSMNVLERTREIGIIRSIGASDRAVISLVMVEGILIGLMSWVLGTFLAIPISSLMSNAINLSLFGAPADFTFTPIGVILWMIVVIVLSTLASVLPARNAASLTIREVLAYE